MILTKIYASLPKKYTWIYTEIRLQYHFYKKYMFGIQSECSSILFRLANSD